MAELVDAQPAALNGLLAAVAATLKEHHADRERQRAESAPEFNPYLCNRLNEVGLSTVLGELLNPAGTHGQGDAFLRRFLAMSGLEDLAEDCRHANVRLEHGTRELVDASKRRIDVVIHGKSWMVGIENKPWAHDQDLQVRDYLRWLRANSGSRYHLLYLTSDGRRPAAASIDEQECESACKARQLILLSYAEVADWINACADCCRAEGVKWFLKYLRDFVNRIVVGKHPEEVNEMLLKTVLEPAHLPAAMQILQSGDEIRIALQRKLAAAVNEQLPKGWKVTRVLVDDVVLGIQIPGVTGGYFAVEVEEGGRAFYGFKREKKAMNPQDPALNRICERIQAQYRNLEPMTDWWPYWRWFDGHDEENSPKEYENWDSSIQPWIDMNDGTMAPRIVALARRLYELGTGRSSK